MVSCSTACSRTCLHPLRCAPTFPAPGRRADRSFAHCADHSFPLLRLGVAFPLKLNELALKPSRLLQVAVSAVAFSAVHLSTEGFVPLCFVGAALGGTFIATGRRLAACTVAHGLYNGAILASFLLSSPQ